MDMDNVSLGKIGENLACEYLVKNGYRVLERNYRTKWDEIDIIAIAKDKTLVFVEVKTLRVLPDSLTPEDNLTVVKRRKISRACQLFAAQKSELIKEDKGWRIDLIAISVKEDGSHEVRYYMNI